MATPAVSPVPPITPDLGTLGELPVTEVAVAIRNGGDGWTDAIKTFPRIHETGTEVFAVVRFVVGPIDHDPLTAEGKRARADDIADGQHNSYRRVEDWLLRQLIEVNGDAVQGWLDESSAAVARIRSEQEEADRIAALEKAEAEALAEEASAGIMRLVPPEQS